MRAGEVRIVRLDLYGTPCRLVVRNQTIKLLKYILIMTSIGSGNEPKLPIFCPVIQVLNIELRKIIKQENYVIHVPNL